MEVDLLLPERKPAAPAGPPGMTGRGGNPPWLMRRSYITTTPAIPTFKQNRVGILMMWSHREVSAEDSELRSGPST